MLHLHFYLLISTYIHTHLYDYTISTSASTSISPIIYTYTYLVAGLGYTLLPRTTRGVFLADAAHAHFAVSLPLHDGRVEVEATNVEDGVG